VGHDEGSKERPVVVVLAIEHRDDLIEVLVAPFTTKPPRQDDDHVLVPGAVSHHLGLGDQKSWIVVSEVNRFRWPGPDLRPVRTGSERTPYYGKIPGQLLRIIRERLASHVERSRLRMTDRSA
jgi:hypothetical protein